MRFLTNENMSKINKRGLAVLFAILLGFSPVTSFAQDSETTFMDNMIYVKFESDAADAVQTAASESSDVVSTGIGAFDALNSSYSAVSLDRVFSDGDDFERRRRAHGLHQWYRISFDGGTSVEQLTEAYNAIPEIVVAEGRPHATHHTDPDIRLYGPNDPLYEDQYAFNNTGQTGGTPGADIRAEAAWQVQSGDTNVVVSIHDSGIDLGHPDLMPNIWFDPDFDGSGSPHGRNFSGAPGNIQDNNGHGTHVTGTVAAVTGNEIGVAGTAGGDGLFSDGRGTGIRFMVTRDIGEAESYVYAADKGAVISQNSWGYTNPGVFPEFMQTAIDYFIDNAGFDADGNPSGPIQGGIVIFAAGNDNADIESYPGFYDRVVAVGATDHNDQRATGWFGGGGSNYGDWVDISAPGDAILSTYIQSQAPYATLSGTSMAAPHVSAAAALVIAQYPELTSPEEVMDILYASADPIDTDFPVGPRLNLAQALLEDDGNPPVAVNDLEVVDEEAASVTLSWTSPEGQANFYMLRYSEDPILDDSDFDDATPVADLPSPSQPGETETVEVFPLTPSTQYYFALRSSDFFGNTSELSNNATATTLGAPVIAFDPEPFIADVETGSQETQTLTISNTGEGTLSWSLPQFAALQLVNDPAIQQNDTGSFPVLNLDKGENDLREGNPVVLGAGGPDDYGYTWIDSNEPGGPAAGFVDISEDGTPIDDIIGTWDDNTVIDLPFDFPFYGESYSEATVSVNGWVHFGDYSLDGFSNQPIPSTDEPNSLLAVFWEDMDMRELGAAYTYHDTENNQFIIQWDDLPKSFDIGSSTTFQAVLSSSGGITYNYGSMSGNLGSNTIGIENQDGTDGLQVAFNTSYVESNLTIQFSPPTAITDWLTPDVMDGEISEGDSQEITATFDADGFMGGTSISDLLQVSSNDPSQMERNLEVTMNVTGGAPEISVSTDTLDFGTVIEGTSSEKTLTVTNTGQNAVLNVSELQIDGEGFSLPPEKFQEDAQLSLEPGETADVDVIFTPDEAIDYSGSLTMLSSDPDMPELEIVLTGAGGSAPQIAFDPEQLAVEVAVGDSTTDVLSILNDGFSPLEFDLSISYSGSELSDDVDHSVFASSREVSEDRNHVTLRQAPSSPDLSEASVNPQPVLSGAWDVETLYWGVLAGENSSFGYFSPDDPAQFTEVSPYPGGSFSSAGTFPVNEDAFVYELDVDGNLRVIDVEDGSATTMGTIGSDWTGMATHPVDGSIYASTGSELYALDIDNMEADLIGDFGAPEIMMGLAIDGDGIMYGYDLQTALLYTIDIETAVAEEVGNIGFDPNFGQGLTWDSQNDLLVMAAFNFESFEPELRIVDRNTGNSTLAGTLAGQFGWIAAPVSNLEWLAADTTEGTVPGESSEELTLNFTTSFEDNESLTGGFDYFADLRFNSNDPQNPETSVPVTMSVTGDADIALSTEQIDFGSSFTGNTVSDEFMVTNEGNAVLQVTAFELESDVFTVHSDPFMLMPGAAMTIPVTFTPDSIATFEATLTVVNNDSDIDVTLSGEGVPFLEITPEMLSEDLEAGETSEQTLTLTNDSNVDVPFSVMLRALETTASGYFPDLTNRDLVRWKQFASYRTTRGTPADQISMQAAPGSNERNSDGSLRGFAELMEELGVTGFANDLIGENIVTFDLGNPGALSAVTASVNSFAANFAAGDNETIYWIDNDTGQLLTFGLSDASVELVGTLNPTSEQTFTDMETDFTTGRTYVTSADGDDNFLYELDVETADLTFVGTFAEGEINIAFAIDDTGQGYGHVITTDELWSIDLETASAAPIGGTDIAANFAQSMTWDSETGQLLLAAFHGPQGEEFGELRIADRETGATVPVGVFGDDGMHEMGWFATPGLGIEWLATNITEGVVDAGETLEVVVTFDASAVTAGSYAGEIIFEGDVEGNPQASLPVNLNVTGSPLLFVSDDSLSFGEQFVGSESAADLVTLRNDGTDVLNITEIEADDAAFVIDAETPVSLEPGQPKVVEVVFAPDVAGDVTGVLSVSSDGGDAEIILTGTGVEPPVAAVTPEEFDVQINPGQVADFNLDVSNSGESDLMFQAMVGEGFASETDGLAEVLIDEDFSGEFPPSGWFTAGANDGGNWDQSQTDNAGGTAPEANLNWLPNTTGTQRLVTPAMQTSSYGEIFVQFRHRLDSWDDGAYEVRLESTGDGGQTWNTVAQFPAEDLGPQMEMISIDNEDVGSDQFHLAWTFEGSTFDIDDWFIDDVMVSGESLWLIVDPDEGVVAPGESTTLTLNVDGSVLTPGESYSLGVMMNTNDPANSEIFVPFDLFVDTGVDVVVDVPDTLSEVFVRQTFEVPITVEELDGLDVFSYQFDMAIDNDIITAVDVVTEGTLSEDAEIEANLDQENLISIAAAYTPEGLTQEDSERNQPIFSQIEGEGVLLKLVFESHDTYGVSDLELLNFMFNEGEPPVNPVDAFVDVVPLFGDVALNYQVNAFDATLVLQDVVNITELDEVQRFQGNVSGGQELTAFDAALILQFIVGIIDTFPADSMDQEEDGATLAKSNDSGIDATAASAELVAGEMTSDEESMHSLPLLLENAESVYSVELDIATDSDDLKMDRFTADLPEGWVMVSNTSEERVRLAFAGTRALRSGELVNLMIEGDDQNTEVTVNGDIRLNNGSWTPFETRFEQVPEEFSLSQNYPNPFNPSTTIRFELPEESRVQLMVYNILGQRVATLVDEVRQSGRHDVTFDASRLSSGTYIYRIHAGDFIQTRKMLYVK